MTYTTDTDNPKITHVINNGVKIGTIMETDSGYTVTGSYFELKGIKHFENAKSAFIRTELPKKQTSKKQLELL